jgi:hypothetical protein
MVLAMLMLLVLPNKTRKKYLKNILLKKTEKNMKIKLELTGFEDHEMDREFFDAKEEYDSNDLEEIALLND